jgi:hypothetical protein
MYVKVYSRCRGEWEPIHVIEVSRTELKREKRVWPNRLHLVITGAEAHKWVRDGGIHGTPLYIDQDNRIRYARDAR